MKHDGFGLGIPTSVVVGIHAVAFIGICFDGPHIVIPDIVVLKSKDNETGNKNHIEVITQGA